MISLTKILLMVLVSVVVCLGEEPKLTITASTDIDTYKTWEVVELTITITNESQDTLVIYNPDYWGVSKIDIYNATGELVKPAILKVNRELDEDTWKISPAKSKSHTYDNLIWYSCCFGNMYTEKQLIPGNYLINLSISCPPDRFPDYLEIENNWIGTLYANTIRITISGYN